MPRNTKIDYEAARGLYVTKGLTYAEVGAELGCSAQNIAARGRRDDWKGQRIAFQQAVQRRGYESIAAEMGSEMAAWRSEAVAVARATLHKYAQDIVNDKVSITAKDAAIMIELLVRELAPEGARENHGAPVIVAGTTPDADVLRRVAEAARGHIGQPVGLGASATVRAPRTRPN